MMGPAAMAARDVIAQHLCTLAGDERDAWRTHWAQADQLLLELRKAGVDLKDVDRYRWLRVRSGVTANGGVFYAVGSGQDPRTTDDNIDHAMRTPT